MLDVVIGYEIKLLAAEAVMLCKNDIDFVNRLFCLLWVELVELCRASSATTHSSFSAFSIAPHQLLAEAADRVIDSDFVGRNRKVQHDEVRFVSTVRKVAPEPEVQRTIKNRRRCHRGQIII